jgi:regulator of protease activity HflC (stomatin/prohibitin superfamily)
MSDTSKTLGRGAVHALTGLCVQILVSGLFLWLTRVYPETPATGHALRASFAGAVVWLHTVFLFVLLKYEADNIKESGETEGTGEAAGILARGTKRARVFNRLYQQLLLPVMEIGVAGLLLGSAYLWFTRGGTSPAVPEKNYLLLIALHSVITLVLIVFSLYLGALMRARTWHLLRSGRNFTNLIGLMVICLLVNACCGHFGIGRMEAITGGVFTVLNTVLAAEILIAMLFRLFAPRRPGVLPRSAFDSYFLEGISHPGRIGRTFSDMLESIFGFDISRTSFGGIVRSMVLPAVVISALILIGMSSVVIVKPGEQGVLLKFGHLHEAPLDAGIHAKLPWPLATVRRYRIDEVRSVHVGSHRPKEAGGSVYQEGVPILWTNMHGITVDELLICSSPNDMVAAAGQNGRRGSTGHKAPSVSLAAADVRIQYVINDVIAHVRAAAAPEAFLENIAEAQASRFIYRYDIDALFCEGRLSLIDELRRAVQDGCNRHSLGVEIVHVAITAVHPPVDVASAFEETVVAMQERETRIQHAGQAAIRSQVETTGSTDVFDALAALTEGVDSVRDEGSGDRDELLHGCGGEISRILAEAEAYRFSRDNIEKGKTERFGEQLDAYEASPRNYRYDRYFSILESGLSRSRKVVLSEGTDEVVLRLGTGTDADFDYLMEDADVMSRRYREER